MRSFERRLNFSGPTIGSGDTEGALPPIRTCNLSDPIRARVNECPDLTPITTEAPSDAPQEKKMRGDEAIQSADDVLIITFFR